MPTSLLADLVLVGHLAFVAFALFGALAALRWSWAPLLHLPTVAWSAYIELSAGICPLTSLENALRRAAGEAGHPGSFVQHYLLPIVYPPGLGPRAQLWLAAGLLLLNALLYSYAFARRRTRLASERSLEADR